MVYRFQTPLMKVFLKNQTLEFFDEKDFKDWESKNHGVKFTSKWYKGLGTSTTAEFKEYVKDLDKYLIPLTIVDDEDFDSIDLAFNRNRIEDRKVWLDLKAV